MTATSISTLLQHAFDAASHPTLGDTFAASAFAGVVTGAHAAMASGAACPICSGLGWTTVETTAPASPERNVCVDEHAFTLPAGFDRPAMRGRVNILCPVCRA